MTAEKPDFLPAALRGLIGKCPNCGEGKIFSRYLKIVENCEYCGEKLGHIRADDGPAWLTMLLVGHILAPVMLNIVPDSDFSALQLIAGGLISALILSLLILPRAKGIFIGVIWRSK